MFTKDYLPAFYIKHATMLKQSLHVLFYSEWTPIKCSFVLFCSRLCTAGVPRYSEALPHGGHEDPNHTSGRQPSCSCSGTSQDGDTHRGWPAPGGAATQAKAQRHEHPDTVWLLMSHVASIAACYILS